MNKLLSSLILLFATYTIHAVGYGSNLIQNAGFELGVSYWGRAEGGNMDYPLKSFSLTNSPARSGNYAMVQRNQTVGGNCWGSFPIRLKASTTYSLSQYGRAAAAGEHCRILIINCRDDGWSGIAQNGTYNPNSDLGGINGPAWTNTITTINTWTRFYTNFTTQAGSNTAYMIRYEPITFGGQEYFIDDIQLEEVTDIFTPPTEFSHYSPVETAIIFPDELGANIFWTNQTVSVPIVTYNNGSSSVSATNVWIAHDYKFDIRDSNSFNTTIAAGVKVTNTLTLTPTTNICGTYRVATWVKGYDAQTVAENTFGVIPRPIPMLWHEATNSYFGSMICFQEYWMTNAYNIGLKWARTLSVGRTNSLLGGQFFRIRTKTTGSSAGSTELTYGDGSPAWLSNGVGNYLGFNSSNGIAAAMAMATNIGFNILGTFEWLRDGLSVVESMTHMVNTTDYTNFTMWPSNYYRFARAVGLSYSPYIKYYEMGNEFDTEGKVGYGTGGASPPANDCCGQEAVIYATMAISNAMNALSSNFPGAIMIPINAFQPDTFDRYSNVLGSAFFTSKILSSHVYGAGEFGAARLYTNTSLGFGVNEHWQTESGTTSKSSRQNFPFEEINQGVVGAEGTKGNEGSDAVQRSAEVIRNYIMWAKWPTHTKWMYHHVDEKRSVLDPQSHTPFDWDGSIDLRGVAISALAQLFEGSHGRSNIVNNQFPTGNNAHHGAYAANLTSFASGVDGGIFARGTTNCPLVVFWATNDLLMYKVHIKLLTNQFNLYDMFGNSQPRSTNFAFGNQPWIVEGQAGVLSNVVWDAVTIFGTNADVVAPKVILTKMPTSTNGVGEVVFRWAARDNMIAQFPQGGGGQGTTASTSACTNLIQYRYKLTGYDAGYSDYASGPTNFYTPQCFTAKYTNVPAGSYVMNIDAKDPSGNIGSIAWNWTVTAQGVPPVPPTPPAGPAGSRLRIGISP